MANDCSCMEVFGEDPNCQRHGIGTDHWAESIVDGPMERAEAARMCLAYHPLCHALERALSHISDLGVRDQFRDVLAKARGDR